MSLKELHAETEIHEKSLKHLFADKQWSLSKENYERLTQFAFDHGFKSIFQIEHGRVWDTFGGKDSKTAIYRGEPRWDTDIEENLRNLIEYLDGEVKVAAATANVASVKKAMREKNCIFVGSPKSNAATEVALSLLFSATPFDGSAANRRRLPVQLLGVDPPARGSAILQPSRKHGFEITQGEKQFIEVHWLPKPQYDRWHGEDHDAAVVVICVSPLGTEAPVTTILIMGYNGLATQSAAQQLIHGDPPLKLERGRPHVLAYEFQFHKTSLPTKRDPRREVHDPPGEWSVLL